jgi:hypothetical protein
VQAYLRRVRHGTQTRMVEDEGPPLVRRHVESNAR